MSNSNMFFLSGKILIIMGACLLLIPTGNIEAAEKRYLTPKKSSSTIPLTAGVRSSKGMKKEPYLGSRLIYKTADTIKTLFTKDPELSLACQRGSFLQKKEMHYIAVVGGRKYGAALYKSNMLHDPKGLGNKDKIYLFKGQGTSNCDVFHTQFNLASN
ncbi:hypothetical protein [Kiloniella antarctica]|uniref:Uncharacterized protein n=1 Tax=Kiloniella antarctica TaxID=1550907 RepID=A0ABW5BNN0_9PROT